MSRTSRRNFPGSPTRGTDFPELDIETDNTTTPAPEPLDPASVAVRILIETALVAADTTAEEAGRDGSVCLFVLPDTSWTEVARDDWKSLARFGGRYVDGGRDYWNDGVWVAWAPTEAPNKLVRSSETGRFATAVTRGNHCVGFTADESWLPPELIHAADYRLILCPMGAADVARVAAELGGAAPAERLTDEQAARTTPTILRLARRIGQTADAYIVKLRDILERSSGSIRQCGENRPADSSPRNAPSLARLHGMSEAVAWGLNVQTDLNAFIGGTLSWADVDRGCLLSGPPGCGKTLFARAMANSCGVPLVSGSYSEWHGSGAAHQGDLLKAMKRTFAAARAQAPSILFIDEIDSFPDRAKITHHFAEWEIQVVNGLLAEIDGVEGREGVILLGACNHPERLDAALIRSGRLDRHIHIGLPNREAVSLILREHLDAELAGEDLSSVALATAGATGADCERLVRGARRRARSAGRDMILTDLLEEVTGDDSRSDADLWLAAIHEAGHVLAISMLRPGATEMVTLNVRGGSGGSTLARIITSVHQRPDDVRDQLIIQLAGRAAEHQMFGVPSSGAGGAADSDLAAATKIAMVSDAAFGFSNQGGMVWRGMPETHLMPRMLAEDPRMEARIRRQLDQAYRTARNLIGSRLRAVEGLARVLVLRRILDGREAEEIVRKYLGSTADWP